MLQVSALQASYGRVPVLTGIDLRLRAGEFLGILGHNGMGKTTLMRTLMGFIPATYGGVALLDDDITHLKPFERVKRGMGYVPQGREIFPALSVLDNLRMGCVAGGRENRAIIDETLQLFPRLTRLLDRQGGALSGGEQQLLALARCLCTRPKLILLDEPTEGIQPSIIEEIAATLQRLRETSGIAMILVEQNLEFIAALSNRVLVIQKGRITGELRPDQLDDPDIVADLIGMAA
ncbi:ABC transporter ATP-binding protein [Lichenihabitans psoromatis]|uniref:ABC transporter ATP-binding protein n=1 Tax=Lichenihabitans psoromatis TaxID=2528642 RepID=UPI001AECFEDA|nr:ATP-binding cassette domain-containing protein [Lichenihabitans psoromatis]